MERAPLQRHSQGSSPQFAQHSISSLPLPEVASGRILGRLAGNSKYSERALSLLSGSRNITRNILVPRSLEFDEILPGMHIFHQDYSQEDVF
jgi:hypothetical protein